MNAILGPRVYIPTAMSINENFVALFLIQNLLLVFLGEKIQLLILKSAQFAFWCT